MAMASIVSYRLSLLVPASFSLAFNDYGFELVSDSPIDIEGLLDNNLLTEQDLLSDLKKESMFQKWHEEISRHCSNWWFGVSRNSFSTNQKQTPASSSQLFYEVFKDYEPENLLYQQALDETLIMVWNRDDCCKPLNASNAKIFVGSKPTNLPPFLFP